LKNQLRISHFPLEKVNLNRKINILGTMKRAFNNVSINLPNLTGRRVNDGFAEEGIRK